MATLRERNRNRTRTEIETAALELFESQGYDATTVEQIARQASVSSATFFRHYPSKEEVLFTNEQAAVDDMVALVAARDDRGQSLFALAEPITSFAHTFLDDPTSQGRRLTRLVMTTRDLEARSMRMRLRWEHALARQLAAERTDDAPADPTTDDVLLANIAIACLSTALWTWQRTPASPASIEAAARTAFARAVDLTRAKTADDR